MGYYMRQNDCNFFIAAEDCDAALQAIKNLKGKETTPNYRNGKEVDFHFSWVNTSDFVNAKTLEEALGAWRWEVYPDEEGDIDSILFMGKKLGDDAILFEAIAPFVRSLSFIEMQGEDGDRWRWAFYEGVMHEQQATITWEE